MSKIKLGSKSVLAKKGFGATGVGKAFIIGKSVFNVVGGLFGGGKGSLTREMRLAQQSIDEAKSKSGFNGNLKTSNAYLKELSKWYTYQGSVKGRNQGAKMIKDIIDALIVDMSSKGYKMSTKTYVQSRSKGDYTVSYPVFTSSNPVEEIFASSFTPFENNSNNSNIQKSGLSKILLYGVGILVLLKIIKK
jgi:hypothetical protein